MRIRSLLVVATFTLVLAGPWIARYFNDRSLEKKMLGRWTCQEGEVYFEEGVVTHSNPVLKNKWHIGNGRVYVEQHYADGNPQIIQFFIPRLDESTLEIEELDWTPPVMITIGSIQIPIWWPTKATGRRATYTRIDT